MLQTDARTVDRQTDCSVMGTVLAGICASGLGGGQWGSSQYVPQPKPRARTVVVIVLLREITVASCRDSFTLFSKLYVLLPLTSLIYGIQS